MVVMVVVVVVSVSVLLAKERTVRGTRRERERAYTGWENRGKVSRRECAALPAQRRRKSVHVMSSCLSVCFQTRTLAYYATAVGGQNVARAHACLMRFVVAVLSARAHNAMYLPLWHPLCALARLQRQ